ncbi:hypothetical protein [Glycomyces sp. NPDC048151]|uniref:hypothetical protein n=1 Tax=Glycomyces sp. NPDC048151 TaxID=3364002 RepID=UPI00371BCC1C
MSAFVKGLAWTVAFLSGVATVFALFGGQQWLEEKGWTLAPSTAQTTEADPGETVTEDTGAEGQEPSDEGAGFSWDAVLAWSEGTFDNLLWGIAAIGCSMLIAGAAGALVLHATAAIDAVGGFFLIFFALLCVAAVIVMGILLHAADPGYLVWFIILTAVSAPVGFLAPVYADS